MQGKGASGGPEAELEELVFPEPKRCFGCSPHNPWGMGVRFFRDGAAVVCPYRFDERFQGAPGVVHGGLQAVLLDEAMCAAVFFARGTYVLTAELHIEYHAPCRTGAAIVARAEVMEERERFAAVRAEIRDAEERLLTTATGRFYYDKRRRVTNER